MKINRFLFFFFLITSVLHARDYSRKDPKYDTLDYKTKSTMFRESHGISMAGSYTFMLGMGLSVAGYIIRDNRLVIPGCALTTVGLPIAGTGNMMMRNVAHPGAGLKPNAWPWYIFGVLFNGILFYEINKDKPNAPVMYTSAGAGTFCLLASWIQFASVRKFLLRRNPEYAVRAYPLLLADKKGLSGGGLAAAVSF